MDCDRYLELLSARMEGALSPGEERALEEHLSRCPGCRAAGAQLAALQAAFPELEELEAPADFTQKVMERIRKSEKKKVIPLFRRPQVRALAGLAACLVLVVGLYGASRQPLKQENAEEFDMVLRSVGQDAAEGDENVAAREFLAAPEPADAPQIAAYAAPVPEDSGTMGGMQKAAPNPAEDGLEDDRPLVEGTTTLERMPEGAAELILPETAVTPTDDGRGSIYLDLPLEVLDQIERLAQEQGIGVTAERCSAPGAEVQYNLVILQPDK